MELLKLLGEDTAEAVLSHMPAEYAAEIRSQIQGDAAPGMRTKQKRALLDDFECFFEFALKSSPRNLNVFDDKAAPQQDNQAEESEPKIQLTGNAMKDIQLLSIHQLSGALAPQRNTLILPLSPERGGPSADPSARVRLPETASWIVLSLELDRPEAPAYRVSLVDAAGETVWVGDDLSPNHLDSLTVSLHSSSLEEGDYTLRAEAGTAPAGRFAFRVLPAG